VSDKALQVPAFLVLTALAGEAQHGYGVIEDVQRISGGRVRLHTGSLYAILDRLHEAGLVEVDREEVVSSRLRRYYRLTGAGVTRLAAETEAMQRNAAAAASRLQRLRQVRPGPAGAQ
jgi:DNA-binding PadR family transcriptional regulator